MYIKIKVNVEKTSVQCRYSIYPMAVSSAIFVTPASTFLFYLLHYLEMLKAELDGLRSELSSVAHTCNPNTWVVVAGSS